MKSIPVVLDAKVDVVHDEVDSCLNCYINFNDEHKDDDSDADTCQDVYTCELKHDLCCVLIDYDSRDRMVAGLEVLFIKDDIRQIVPDQTDAYLMIRLFSLCTSALAIRDSEFFANKLDKIINDIVGIAAYFGRQTEKQ